MSNRNKLWVPRGRRAGRRSGPFTFDDFCTLIREDQKADLIDGMIYMASPESLDNNDLFMWLSGLLRDYVESKRLGRVFGSRVAFRLEDKGGPEPDIAFVQSARTRHGQYGFFDGPPDLAIEIVSPDSVERDYEHKKDLYEVHGVTEYWIVDDHLKRLSVYRLDAQGKYRDVRPRKGVYRSEVVEGFWLRAEWLWTGSRPDKIQVLAQLLA
jgi:Uma2 family endonuclease